MIQQPQPGVVVQQGQYAAHWSAGVVPPPGQQRVRVAGCVFAKPKNASKMKFLWGLQACWCVERSSRGTFRR